MALVSQEQLNTIRRSVNIVDVISRYIHLEHKGSNYWGICPFHQDTNPSMCVSEEKQIFTCFVCHKTGNCYEFVKEYEHLSFVEAVKKIADMANIKLDVNIKSREVLANSNLYKIYEDTQKIYQNNINNALGKEAREYLYNRGINDDIIKEFGIGLSLKTRDVLVKSFVNKKYEIKDLLESGLVIKNQYGLVDIYTNRIMFPLWDLNGRIVGYSGRIYMGEDASKYINSKESPIFKKGELLYNYHRSKEICRNTNTVIVMEGFMDIIASYKVGVLNTVAMMGTAVTRYQANLIKRMASNIILLFDGDDAGAKATMSSIDEFLSVNVTPKIVRLEDGLDPDEYINKYGPDKFKEKIDNPINIMDFKLNYLKKGRDLTSDVEKAKYVNDILGELKNIDDQVLIELTLKKVEKESGLDIEFLKSQIKREEVVEEVKPVLPVPKLSKYKKAEQSLLYYMLYNIDAIKVYNDIITYIPDEKYRILARKIDYFYKECGNIDVASFLDTVIEEDEMKQIVGDIVSLNLKEDISKRDLEDLACAIQEYNIKTAKLELEKQLHEEDNTTKKVEIAEKIKELGEEIRRLKIRGNE